MKEQEIERLTKKLSDLKKKQEQEEWEKYLNETEEYLKSLIGKTFMRPYQNGRFIMFKVKNYRTSYYIDRSGFNGQWSPSRWFELESSATINCSVKDRDGNYHRPEIKYTNLVFNKVTGKSKNRIETSGLDLINHETEKYYYLPTEVREFGKISYEEGVPNFQRDRHDFGVFLREVPEQMWLDAKAIADENIMKTYKFWDKYQKQVQNF